MSLLFSSPFSSCLKTTIAIYLMAQKTFLHTHSLSLSLSHPLSPFPLCLFLYIIISFLILCFYLSISSLPFFFIFFNLSRPISSFPLSLSLHRPLSLSRTFLLRDSLNYLFLPLFLSPLLCHCLYLSWMLLLRIMLSSFFHLAKLWFIFNGMSFSRLNPAQLNRKGLCRSADSKADCVIDIAWKKSCWDLWNCKKACVEKRNKNG